MYSKFEKYIKVSTTHKKCVVETFSLSREDRKYGSTLYYIKYLNRRTYEMKTQTNTQQVSFARITQWTSYCNQASCTKRAVWRLAGFVDRNARPRMLRVSCREPVFASTKTRICLTMILESVLKTNNQGSKIYYRR